MTRMKTNKEMILVKCQRLLTLDGGIWTKKCTETLTKWDTKIWTPLNAFQLVWPENDENTKNKWRSVSTSLGWTASCHGWSLRWSEWRTKRDNYLTVASSFRSVFRFKPWFQSLNWYLSSHASFPTNGQYWGFLLLKKLLFLCCQLMPYFTASITLYSGIEHKKWHKMTQKKHKWNT